MAHPQVAAFARLANGGAKPTRAIAGQNTQFTRTIHDMAYDPVKDEILIPQFFAFAILTFDGGANGNVPPKRIIMGDKTQIATIVLAAQYQPLYAIVIGTTLGMMIANVPAVYLGNELVKRIPLKVVHWIAAALFFVIGVWLLAQTAGWLGET